MDKEEEKCSLDSFNLNYFTFTRFVILFSGIFLLKIYNLEIINPFIIFIILFINELVYINCFCEFDKQPISEIFNKSLILLSSFLYFDYTIKCIPIFSLTINKVFDMMIFGEIFKIATCYILMLIVEYIISYCLKENDLDKDPECRIVKMPNNMTIQFMLFTFILLNTYLDYFFIKNQTDTLLLNKIDL